MPDNRTDCSQKINLNGSKSLPARVLPPEEAGELAVLFKTLGDPTRIGILYLLTQREHCVQELAENSQVSLSAVSHQLRLLKANRLIKSRRDGRNIIYSLDDEHVEDLFKQGLAHVRHR